MYTIDENGERVYTLKVSTYAPLVFIVYSFICFNYRNALRTDAPLSRHIQHAFHPRTSTRVSALPSRSVSACCSPRSQSPSIKLANKFKLAYMCIYKL